MTTMRNAVTLIGRTGHEPEIRKVGKTKRIARFSLATADYFPDKNGGWVQHTYWHSIVAFGRIAETIEKHVRKGQQIAIEGRLSTNVWEDQDGNRRSRVDVVANQVIFLQKAN